MSRPEWHIFADAEQMSAAVATHVETVIAAAVKERGKACLAVAGGKTPIPAFRRLAQARGIDWDKVTLLPTDERLVAPHDDLSNLHLIDSLLGSTGARIVPLTRLNSLTLDAAADYADHVLRALDWPLELLWLGMGADGHTGSILPGGDFRRALDESSGLLALALTPDPMPPEAPVARVTLTLGAMVQTRSVMLTITGAKKRDVLERAIAHGSESKTAIGAVLARMTVPVDLFWAP